MLYVSVFLILYNAWFRFEPYLMASAGGSRPGAGGFR